MILTDGTHSVTLPAALRWVDEYDWEPLVVGVKRAITGVPIIRQSTRAGGRPVTLDGGPDCAWLDRTMLEALRALDPAQDPWLLTGLRTAAKTVLPLSDWIQADPVFHDPAAPAGQKFWAKLKLIEV